KGLSLPIFLDPTGRTADLFGTKVTTTTVVIDGDGVLRYCGRFADGDHAYAEEALKAVLAGEGVPGKTTPHDGWRGVRREPPCGAKSCGAREERALFRARWKRAPRGEIPRRPGCGR